MSDARLDYPATSRNREPILAVLKEWLSPQAQVLELGCGSGQHAAYFVPRLGEGLRWTPTDPDPACVASANAWLADSGLESQPKARQLDCLDEPWGITGPFDTVYCANVVHIAPWAVAKGMMRGSAALLGPGGQLITYGPYRRNGAHTSESNAAFDERLKSRNPDWGVRDLEAIETLAAEQLLNLDEVRQMPANNLMLRFVRTS